MMRIVAILMAAAASLAGCEREPEPPAAQGAATPISFDGTGATGPARQAHGERLTRVLGCHGCHGEGLTGQKWDDDPKGYGVFWASNLTRAIPAMSDGQLEALLRKGAHPTRPDMWIMPSEIFQHLSDADMAALLAYLRTVKPDGETSPPPVLGPKAIEEIRSGKVKPAEAMVRDPKYALPPDLGAATAQGRYIISVTCTECHGGQLQGTPGDTPDLIVAGAYSRAEFERLMTAGIPSGNRKLKNDLMAAVAKSRFSKMTVAERDAVYAYLKARAERPQ